MYKLLRTFLQRPDPFEVVTAKELWTRPHLARQMLKYHLDQSNDLATRNPQAIAEIIDWLENRLSLNGKQLCDLGCGPGLYAELFCDRGARVTGLDFSPGSIEYAKQQARSKNLGISYLVSDYVEDPLPESFDVASLVYFDYCALAPEARKALLDKIFATLNREGFFVFDVLSASAFARKEEAALIERRLMNGFWSERDYIGLQKTFLYQQELLSLDRYLIVEETDEERAEERDKPWQVYNWLQHFTPESIAGELAQAGFAIDTMTGSLSGEELTPESDSIGIIARKP